MQKSLLSTLLILFMSFCAVTVTVAQKKYSPSSYIEAYKSVAQQLMRETGVPASVILAIAMHESAYGNSRIALHLNNHFGFKGKNSSKTIRSAYKGYESVLSSYHDFVGMLKRKKSTQTLFESCSSIDYRGWVKGIARSGYSLNKGWSNTVLATINKHQLSQYDEKI